MNRLFRKYHRWMAILFSLPLMLTVLTGIGSTIASEWFHHRPDITSDRGSLKKTNFRFIGKNRSC